MITKKLRRAAMGLALASALPFALPAIAQIAVTEVSFPRGASSTTVSGAIVGSQVRDYIVRASAGQTMTVRLTGKPYFNVLEPGSSDVAIYNGSMNGSSYSGVLSRSGPYKIRVYQMGAAKGGARSPFTLSISVTGRGGGGASAGGGMGSIAGIKGMDGIKAFDVLRERGFANVDSFSSGNTLYGIYYYRPARLCVQTTSADNVILDIRDIKTHPKCR